MTDYKNNWMQFVDGKRKLLELNIPGTHDCATQFVQTSKLSCCQSLNIKQQLECGVRALDVRVAARGKRLILVHSNSKVFKKQNAKKEVMYLEDFLEVCYDFLDSNKSEAVIFQFKNDSNDKNDKRCFENLFYTYIKENEERWFLENRMPTLDEARGKLVLLRRCYIDGMNPDFENKSGLDLSRWLDQDTALPHPLLLRTYSSDLTEIIIHDRYKYKPQPRWELCIEPFLRQTTAFDGRYILCYLSTAGGFKGPKFNADYINSRFINASLDKTKYYGLVYFDFINPALARKIIELNF